MGWCKWNGLWRSCSHFSLLTVGDGIVSSNSCTIISTATGIVVTRAASKGNLGEDITSQLLSFPKMLYIAGGTILCLGLFTPINDLLTIPIAGLLAFGGYRYVECASNEDQEEILGNGRRNMKR